MAQAPKFLNLLSHGLQYLHSHLYRHQCTWSMVSSSDSPSVLHTFPGEHREKWGDSYKPGGFNEAAHACGLGGGGCSWLADLSHCVVSALLEAISLLPAAASPETWSLAACSAQKGLWWLTVFSFHTTFVSFSTDLIPVMETFAWKFHLCLRNICSPVPFTMTDALLLHWFNNFYSLPSLT